MSSTRIRGRSAPVEEGISNCREGKEKVGLHWTETGYQPCGEQLRNADGERLTLCKVAVEK
jgi:hypothetical protein